MKKTLLSLVLVSLLLPSLSLASIDYNLKYGMKNTEVSELQDFLVDQNLLSQSTGFFGLLTLKAVQKFQTSSNIPSTGYVGILTRTKINSELDVATGASNEAEVSEIGTSTPTVCGEGVAFNTQTGARCGTDPLSGQITQLQNQINGLQQSINKNASTQGTSTNSTSTPVIQLPDVTYTVGGEEGITYYTNVCYYNSTTQNGSILYSVANDDSHIKYEHGLTLNSVSIAFFGLNGRGIISHIKGHIVTDKPKEPNSLITITNVGSWPIDNINFETDSTVLPEGIRFEGVKDRSVQVFVDSITLENGQKVTGLPIIFPKLTVTKCQ